MEKFVWSDSLSTGVAMIDTHHKLLIDAINDLGTAIDQGEGGSAIKKLLVFLESYAEFHFDHEEKCAAKHLCPMAEINKQAHSKFLATVKDLKTAYRESGASDTIARQIHQELSDWLKSHILKIDTQLGEYIRAGGG